MEGRGGCSVFHGNAATYPASSSRVMDVFWYSSDGFFSLQDGDSMPRDSTVQKRSTSNSSILCEVITLRMFVVGVGEGIQGAGPDSR